MINKYKEMAEKLVCISTPGNEIVRDCKNCRYRALEEVWDKVPIPPDIEIDGKGYWINCDTDRICSDAAKLLKEAASAYEQGKEDYIKHLNGNF